MPYVERPLDIEALSIAVDEDIALGLDNGRILDSINWNLINAEEFGKLATNLVIAYEENSMTESNS